MNHNIPWQLRLSHKGCAHIQAEWVGGNIHFDPNTPVEDGDIVVLLWNWPERLLSTAKTLQKGKDTAIDAGKKLGGQILEKSGIGSFLKGWGS